MALNWITDVFTDQRILSATGNHCLQVVFNHVLLFKNHLSLFNYFQIFSLPVCGAVVGASIVYTLTKPEKRRGGAGENSKWDKKPLRDYCIQHTNIIEPKPLVLLRQVCESEPPLCY